MCDTMGDLESIILNEVGHTHTHTHKPPKYSVIPLNMKYPENTNMEKEKRDQ